MRYNIAVVIQKGAVVDESRARRGETRSERGKGCATRAIARGVLDVGSVAASGRRTTFYAEVALGRAPRQVALRGGQQGSLVR